MTTLFRTTVGLALVAAALVSIGSTLSGQGRGRGEPPPPPAAQPGHPSGQLIIWGDVVNFNPQGTPGECTLQSRFKRGERIGFRMTAIDGGSGETENTATLVAHLTYAGKTVDVPMRDRQNEKQPEREFWVAKWVVPDDAPMGIVRYTVTAKDPQGRTGEFKPFEVQASQITIVP
jgi:hypothetical protein